AAIDAMVRRVIAAFERIDVLVNNAGVTRRAYIMDLTEADWDRIMRVNAKGVFFCLQRVAREMIPRRSGVIVNIASIAGKGYAGTSNAIYAASKAAVMGLTRIAALQLARPDINVNAICPGTTVTALSNDNLKTRALPGGRPVASHERRRRSGLVLTLLPIAEPGGLHALGTSGFLPCILRGGRRRRAVRRLRRRRRPHRLGAAPRRVPVHDRAPRRAPAGGPGPPAAGRVADAVVRAEARRHHGDRRVAAALASDGGAAVHGRVGGNGAAHLRRRGRAGRA